MWGKLTVLSVAALLCAPAAAYAQDGVYDPYEGMNRRLYATHDVIDRNVLEPIAHGYRAVTNDPIRTGVSNFLHNLKSPVILANDVLQAEPGRAGTTIARFGINSTLGILGLFDPASGMGFERHDEDFGQTLAVWGVGSGPYFFVPVLGPTNLRDGAGRVIDMAFDPLNWSQFEGDSVVRGTRGAMTGISTREALIEEVDGVRENSLDPYVTFRSSYGLLRESAIRNGLSDVQDLPDFAPIEDEPDATPLEGPYLEPQNEAPASPEQETEQPEHASTPADAETSLGDMS